MDGKKQRIWAFGGFCLTLMLEDVQAAASLHLVSLELF